MSMKQGQGHYTWPDGSTYDGEWVQNDLQGYGSYKWADNRLYHGTWFKNQMHGQGIYIYADGIRYDGQYEEDKKEGYGIYYWPDGRKYDGWWHKGRQHGVGFYLDPKKGSVKYGMWEHGKRLQWCAQDEIDQINNGSTAYTKNFKEVNSATYVKSGATFSKPASFDAEMGKVK